MLSDYAQRLSYAHGRMAPGLRAVFALQRRRLASSEQRLARRDPKVALAELRGRFEHSLSKLRAPVQSQLGLSRARLDTARKRFEIGARRYLDGQRAGLAGVGRQLHALSPLQTLERGFAIAIDDEGGAVRDADLLEPGQRLRLKLHKGEREVIVE